MELSKNVKQMLEKPWIRITFLSATTLFLAIIILGVADFALHANKVHKGVEVNGIHLGGKTKSQAIKSVEKLANILENEPVFINHNGKNWSIKPGELSARVNKETTVRKAFDAGRKGGPADLIKQRAALWFKDKDVGVVFDYDHDKLGAFIEKVAENVDKPFEDAEIKVVDGRVVVTSSKNGYKVNRDRLSKSILKALSSRETRKIKLPVGTIEPDIHEKNLAGPKDLVRQMTKAPVVIKYQDESWTITTGHIIDWVSFNKVRRADSWELDVSLDKGKVISYLEKTTASITIEPRDAEFSIEDDKVRIIPGESGRKVDFEKAIEGILEACKTDTDRVAMLSTVVVEPKLTTEDAEKMGIKEKVSSFTTYFNPNQRSRVHNIKTLARELDGNIVAPDEVFSFNGNIGPRTASKGYEEASAIVNGELVPALGGGICQVATTLFNTIFFGGYEVLERYNHSLFISSYPAGRDATVSYGGPDLKFQNNTDAYILIKAVATASSVTVSFYSTDQGIKVEYTTSGPSNLKDYPTQREDDPTLPKGVTKVVEKGAQGRDITVHRTVIKDGDVVKKDKFFSRYKPKTAIVRVGTKQDDVQNPGPGVEPSNTQPAPNQVNAPVIAQ